MRVLLCLILVNFSLLSGLKAQNLQQIYNMALSHDPTLKAALATFKGQQQALPQAIAKLSPQLSAFYTTQYSQAQLSDQSSQQTKSFGLNLTQPLYQPALWAQIEQARHLSKSAQATYLNVAQNLIIRVASGYFSTLAAIDDLNFSISQRKAFARELAQTEQRFRVGLVANTEVQEARARHDSAVANEIAAQNAVSDEYEKLREITGKPITHITRFPTKRPLPLLEPSPNKQEIWVNTAREQNLALIAAKKRAQQLKAAIGAQVAAHFPQVEINAQLQRYNSFITTSQLTSDRNLSLSITLPLFEGGGALFRTKEAQAYYQQALSELENKQRIVESTTRQSFRGVLTTISSVKALAQALASSQSALEATQAAYEAGTRTIVDVLDAKSHLLSAKRDHAKARYTYLLEGLKLKQAAGTLSTEDLLSINQLIMPIEKKATP